MSDLAISPQKYPKIGTQEKEKCQGICDTVFQNYVAFLRSFEVVFHMFKCIVQTFNQNKNCSWDKTGEGNVVLDYAISAQKYPKIVSGWNRVVSGRYQVVPGRCSWCQVILVVRLGQGPSKNR